MRRSIVWLALPAVAIASAGAFLARQASHRRSLPAGPGLTRTIGGEVIHYLDEGSGEAVVLIHGLAGNTWSWRLAVPPLAKDYRVVALDLPGFGYSDRNPQLPRSNSDHAARVVRLMDELRIDRATLVGHSMGGAVAQRIAATFPNRVARLVLVCAVDASESGEWGTRRRPGRLSLLAMSLAFRVPMLIRFVGGRALRSVVFDPGHVTREVIDGYVDPLLLPGTGACLRRQAEDSLHDQAADLSRIAAPTLVISGESDPAIPPRAGAQLSEKIPGARHVVLEQAGHLAAEEQPEAFNELLRAFLAGPPGAP